MGVADLPHPVDFAEEVLTALLGYGPLEGVRFLPHRGASFLRAWWLASSAYRLLSGDPVERSTRGTGTLLTCCSHDLRIIEVDPHVMAA
jgi:hypothetical protein